jgi:hypothetical protein
VQLEGLDKLKKSTSSGIRTGDKQYNLYDLAGNLPPTRSNLKNMPDIQNFWIQKNWRK